MTQKFIFPINTLSRVKRSNTNYTNILQVWPKEGDLSSGGIDQNSSLRHIKKGAVALEVFNSWKSKEFQS